MSTMHVGNFKQNYICTLHTYLDMFLVMAITKEPNLLEHYVAFV